MQKRLLPPFQFASFPFILSVLWLLLGSPDNVRAQAPANNNCVNAINLTVGNSCTPTAGTTVGATQSLPAITCNNSTGIAEDDVWYKFTATSSYHFVTVVGEGNFNAVIDVRSGACNGTTIACADAILGGGTETVNLPGLSIGSTYYVRIYSWSNLSTSPGAFTICIQNALVNDECANALTLTSFTSCTPTEGTTRGATQSLPAIKCDFVTGEADDDVWYKFNAVTTTHTVTVVAGAGFDAAVDVRSGVCNGTANIACAHTGYGGTKTIALSGLTIGSTYYVRVYSNGPGAYYLGNFSICVTHPVPANDQCSDAVTITSSPSCTPTNGTTVGATQSLAAINCNGMGTADDDVWYKFTAVSTTHTVTAAGNGSFNAVIDVRSGVCNGTTIACADATSSDGTETIVLSGLTIGSIYYIRVYSRGSTSSNQGTFSICVTHVPPANDECSNAVTLTPNTSCISTTGTTVGASQSLAAINCNGTGTADDDVWYKFTGVATAQTVTVVGGTGFDAVIDVRSGACNGTTIACADATTSGETETLGLTGLTIGSTYYVRVYSRGSTLSDRGTFTICIQNPPANNECSTAVTITSGAVCNPTAGTTVNASQSLAASCGGTADDDVWYKFTAVATNHTITVVGGAEFDAVIEVRSGVCNGTFIDCDDATDDGETETLYLSDLTIGSTYYVRVYSQGSTSSNQGTFSICVTHVPPANDECSNAVTLTSNTFCLLTDGTTVGASQSLAASCGGTADDDVWYKFTVVAASQTITVVSGAGFDAVIEVREGPCNGTPSGCGNNTGVGGTEILGGSGLTIGSTYYVRVYGYGNDPSNQGTFTICVTHTPPANDDCANAITLTSSTSCIPTTGTTVGATQSLAAIACGAITGLADDDVWYKFIAVATTHSVTTAGIGTFNPVIDIRSGSCNGTTIACADATSAAGTETVNLSGLTVGTTYYVRIYSRGSAVGTQGDFTICVTHAACPATLVVTETITSGTVVKEAVKVTATNQVSGGIVTYKAAQSVTLQPGFRATTDVGNLFQAMIGGCP